MERARALALIGPTGSGKTPLGDRLESRGLWGRRCHHFDFGRWLRAVDAGREGAGLLVRSQLDTVRRALATGAVLEDGDFDIARRVLTHFIARQSVGPADLLVLNGLRRHVGQARALEPLVAVEAVVELRCAPEVVVERIRADAGGDRAGRPDDRPDAVLARLATFARRTLPLIEHYRQRGARILSVQVGTRTTAEDVLRELEESATG